MIKFFAVSCTMLFSICLYAQKGCTRLIDVPWTHAVQLKKGVVPNAENSDTGFSVFFDAGWRKTSSDRGHIYTEAYRKGEHWIAEDYDVFDKYLLQIASYADPALSQPDGPYYYFYANGAIMLKGNFAPGGRQGWWIGGDRNGNTLDSIQFEKGIPTGVGKRYYPSGKLRATLEFKYPEHPYRCAYTEYFEDGVVRIQGHYAHFPDYPIGQWRSFHHNGKLHFDISYPLNEFQLNSDFNRFDRGACYDSFGNSTGTCVVQTGGYLINSNWVFGQWINRHWKELQTLKNDTLINTECVIAFTLNSDRSITDFEVETHSTLLFDYEFGRLLSDNPPPFEIPHFFGVPESVRFQQYFNYGIFKKQ